MSKLAGEPRVLFVTDMYTEPLSIPSIVEDYLAKTDDDLVIFIAEPDENTKVSYNILLFSLYYCSL